jgi:hypothetical protein
MERENSERAELLIICRKKKQMTEQEMKMEPDLKAEKELSK